METLELFATLYAVLKLVLFAVLIFWIGRMLMKTNVIQFLIDLHSESVPRASWIRGMGTLIITTALVLVSYQIVHDQDVNNTTILSMLGIGITGKVIQKHIETKK